MKQYFQNLVAKGDLDSIFVILLQINSNAVPLKTRYNNGKKQYDMGLIYFEEWQRIQNQVNFAILEMISNFPVAGRYERLLTKSGVVDRVRLTEENNRYLIQVCDSDWNTVGETSPLILSQFRLFTATEPYKEIIITQDEKTGEVTSTEEVEVIPYSYVGK